MLYKFHIIGLAKFRHLAILAIFGGYFGYLFARMGLPDFVFYIFGSPMMWTIQNGIPFASTVFFLKLVHRHMCSLVRVAKVAKVPKVPMSIFGGRFVSIWSPFL